jgi:hypothetical protein
MVCRKRGAAGLATLGLLLAGLPAWAGQAPAGPAATDPVAMGWMQGTPPPPERRIGPGTHYDFPQSRWTFIDAVMLPGLSCGCAPSGGALTGGPAYPDWTGVASSAFT